MTPIVRRSVGEPAAALRLVLQGLALAAVLVPIAFVGLGLARALGAVLLAAAVAFALLPGWPEATTRNAQALGLALGAAVLLLHPLEGVVSAPTVVMVVLGWMAAVAAVVAVRRRNDAASFAAVGPMVMVFLILTGWVCGRFWLLGLFVGAALWLAARVVASARGVSRAAPPPAPPVGRR